LAGKLYQRRRLTGYGLLLLLLIRRDTGVDGGYFHGFLLLVLWIHQYGVPGSEPEWQMLAPAWWLADDQKHIPTQYHDFARGN
jgi:hypothetical protein